MFRRHFFKSAGLLGLANVLNLKVSAAPAEMATRQYWLSILEKIASPVLTALAGDQLKVRMPVESTGKNREIYSHLEAFGRLLAGIAPWLNLEDGTDKNENELRSKYFSLTVKALQNAVNPSSKDYMNFTEGGQPLVDAAFLANGLVRSPKLWNALSKDVQKQVHNAFLLTRNIKPGRSNWLLFSGMIEAFFLKYGFEYDKMRVDYAISQHEQWYKGDGIYGDGPDFHWDYYNSFVIQPFLTDILRIVALQDKSYSQTLETIMTRAVRYAAVQERFVATDGSFPVIGRSIVYRGGAFQNLANITLLQKLPKELKPAQVREALTAVIRKTNENPENYDTKGWLRIGLNGHQPRLSEAYISTGSLYLCSTIFLPLGLAPENEFWAAPPQPWTSKKVWNGEDLDADHAIK
jgi:hypothetical protein